MTDDTDILVKWGDEIAFAEGADFPAEPDHRTTVGDAKYMAIRDLAAEVRRLRENEVCADTECRDLHIRDLTAEIAELRERLAAQERLAGSAVTTDDALRVWMQGMEHASGQAHDVRLATALACITELETENEALRERLAAQDPDGRLGRVEATCGDCGLRVEYGPLAGECHYDPDPWPEKPACEFFETGNDALRRQTCGE